MEKKVEEVIHATVLAAPRECVACPEQMVFVEIASPDGVAAGQGTL